MQTRQSPHAPPATRGEPWYRETAGSAVKAALIALVGAALIGGLTSFGQQYLPPWVNSLANSAGGWTMFSFLLVWLGRARPLLGAFLGVVVFQVLTEAYSVVSEWRGYDDGAPFTSVWTVVGLIAGPLLGASASLVRHGTPLWRMLGVTPLSAVLLGEGIWALDTVALTTGWVYWTLEIVLSMAFMAVAVALGRRSARSTSLVICVWLLGTLAYIGVCVLILG